MKKTNNKTKDIIKKYLTVTYFVDGTFENEIVTIQHNNTIEDIANFKLNKYNQLLLNEDSVEPKVKDIDIFEIGETYRRYRDLDILFRENKRKLLENKQKHIKEETTVE